MVYYTIYIKNLYNSTGYIDVCLTDDQLIKDYQQFLDIGLKAHRLYNIAAAGVTRGSTGSFAINLSEIAAITITSTK